VTPTFFEVTTAMGLRNVPARRIEVAVIEVRVLAGAFDATNVITPGSGRLSTTIGMDHEQHLGTTIAAIAGEKAGISRTAFRSSLASCRLTRSRSCLLVADERGSDVVEAQVGSAGRRGRWRMAAPASR
jgi:folylpolyglutamate synthase/dihydropteroate synthase